MAPSKGVSPVDKEGVKATPKLSEAWDKFVKWKDWTPRRTANNQRMFESVLFFLGDRPVGDISRDNRKTAFERIAKLPLRNLRPYRGKPLEDITKGRVPERYRISGKSVKEHLKLCQGLFGTYLVDEAAVLDRSPTQGFKLNIEDKRFGSLTDVQMRGVIKRSQSKPEWFQRFLKLAVYSGARRSEIAGLRGDDFKLCEDTNRYFFSIRSGKTKAARRNVPLHSLLVNTNFHGWAMNHGKDLLFRLLINTMRRYICVIR